MRIVLVASTAAALGLIVSGALGVAGAAETTPTTTATTTTTTTVTSTTAAAATPLPRTVAVQGVATEPIDPNADAAVATGVYRQGMADAVNDGQAKAQFLAGKAAATLGQIQSMSEGGGYIGCAEGVEYKGEQPDFGSSDYVGNAVAGASVPAIRRPLHSAKPTVKHPKAHKRHSAKKAAVASCTLSTQVALVYALN
jgi:hypothetical protein